MKCKHPNIKFWAFIAECLDCGRKAPGAKAPSGSISSGKLKH